MGINGAVIWVRFLVSGFRPCGKSRTLTAMSGYRLGADAVVVCHVGRGSRAAHLLP